MPIYCYTVCYKTKYCKVQEWKFEEFPCKDYAKQFARHIKRNKIKPKPYIVKTIKMWGYFNNKFKEDVLEQAKQSEKYYDYYKIIRY